MSDLGWWVVHGEEILEMLNAVADGNQPDIVFAEFYANSEIDVGEQKGELNAP